jgi:hypothetical protein
MKIIHSSCSAVFRIAQYMNFLSSRGISNEVLTEFGSTFKFKCRSLSKFGARMVNLNQRSLRTKKEPMISEF